MSAALRATSSPGGRLKSELARLCLPAANRDATRKLAWTNSVCLLFLLVGVFGAKPPSMTIKPVKPLDDVVPVIVEPVAPPPPAATVAPKEEPDKAPDDTPQVVAVVLDSPAVNFSVPTIGNLLLPKGMAALPPVTPMKQAAVLQRQPTTINSTGQGGERPYPSYPTIALQQGLQGSVTLSITVDETGLITAIEVKRSSGSPLLDRSALDFVKKHWIIPPSDGSRSYEATITYRLKN